MKPLFIAVFLLLLPSYTVAQETATDILCSQISKEHLAGANYVPGVDIDGFHVVGADLNDGSNAADNPIIIPIEIDLATRFGLDLPNGARLLPSVSQVALFQNGRVEYNGRDISSEAHAVCDEQNNPPRQAKENGQGGKDILPSGEIIEGQYP